MSVHQSLLNLRHLHPKVGQFKGYIPYDHNGKAGALSFYPACVFKRKHNHHFKKFRPQENGVFTRQAYQFTSNKTNQFYRDLKLGKTQAPDVMVTSFFQQPQEIKQVAARLHTIQDKTYVNWFKIRSRSLYPHDKTPEVEALKKSVEKLLFLTALPIEDKQDTHNWIIGLKEAKVKLDFSKKEDRITFYDLTYYEELDTHSIHSPHLLFSQRQTLRGEKTCETFFDRLMLKSVAEQKNTFRSFLEMFNIFNPNDKKVLKNLLTKPPQFLFKAAQKGDLFYFEMIANKFKDNLENFYTILFQNNKSGSLLEQMIVNADPDELEQLFKIEDMKKYLSKIEVRAGSFSFRHNASFRIQNLIDSISNKFKKHDERLTHGAYLNALFNTAQTTDAADYNQTMKALIPLLKDCKFDTTLLDDSLSFPDRLAYPSLIALDSNGNRFLHFTYKGSKKQVALINRVNNTKITYSLENANINTYKFHELKEMSSQDDSSKVYSWLLSIGAKEVKNENFNHTLLSFSFELVGDRNKETYSKIKAKAFLDFLEKAPKEALYYYYSSLKTLYYETLNSLDPSNTELKKIKKKMRALKAEAPSDHSFSLSLTSRSQ